MQWMIQIKKYLAQIRVVFCHRVVGTKLPFQGEEMCTFHESSWAAWLNLHPRSGHVASVPTFILGVSLYTGEGDRRKPLSVALKARIC